MKRFLAGLLLALPTSSLLAQGTAAEYADDAFRYNDFVQQGSARFRGIGGNQAALGGDASNIAGNPAGLGFYNRSEFTISPSVNLTSARSGYLGSNVDANKTNFNIGQMSLVFAGEPSRNSRWRRSSFGISYSQSLNFSSTVDAQGRNNNTNSTFLNEYIPGLNTGAPGSVKERALSDDFTGSTARTPEAALYGLFLINPTVYGATAANPNGTVDTNGSPFYRLDPTLPLNQRVTANRSGANSQWTFAYGANFDDKLYIGASANISRIRYNSENTIRESPINGQFDNYGRTNSLAVTGTGFGVTVGAIYRPIQSLQVGASASSPTFFSMKETYQQTFFGFAGSSSTQLLRDLTVNSVAVDPNDFNYSMTTPFRASGGFTYFLGGGKLGFLTATADYVGYGGMRIGTDAFNSTQGNQDFKNDVTSEVKNTYQNVVNVRGGVEIRASMLRIRGGVAYLPSAYRIDLDRVSADSRSRILFSGGVGIRNDRFSLDLSGSYYDQKTGLSPYVLSDSNTPTVSTTSQRTNVMASVGFFF